MEVVSRTVEDAGVVEVAAVPVEVGTTTSEEQAAATIVVNIRSRAPRLMGPKYTRRRLRRRRAEDQGSAPAAASQVSMSAQVCSCG